MDDHLTTALRSYFSAISEPDDEMAFLSYWRCLEAATLTTDEDFGASDPLKRGRAAARPELGMEINDERIELLTEKRNSLGHEGGQVNITSGDREYLKTMADHALYFLVTDREEYTFEEFQDFYNIGSKYEESIKQARADREKDIREKLRAIDELEDKIERIDQVIEWLDIQEE